MIFKNVEHALKWAFGVSATVIVKGSGINAMRGSSGSGDLTPHDRHAQAALIIGMAERVLNVNQMAFVLAKFGCALNGGEHERAVADQLTKVVIASLPTGMHSRRGYEKLIRCHFGAVIGVQAIRKDLACGMADVQKHKKIVNDALSDVWNSAYMTLDANMLEHGLIGDMEKIA